MCNHKSYTTEESTAELHTGHRFSCTIAECEDCEEKRVFIHQVGGTGHPVQLQVEDPPGMQMEVHEPPGG